MALETLVRHTQARLATLADKVGGMANSFLGHFNAVDNDLAGLHTSKRLDSLQDDLAAAKAGLQDQIKAMGADVGGLKTRMTGVEGRTTAVENAIAALQAQIAALQHKIDLLGNSIDTIDSTVSTLQGTVGGLLGTVTTIQGSLVTPGPDRRARGDDEHTARPSQTSPAASPRSSRR